MGNVLGSSNVASYEGKYVTIFVTFNRFARFPPRI
jgi:hypothetical protein